jgi:hypothetical protein
MKLFIRIKDGQPFEHPILCDNFRASFPDVDTNNLPPEFAKFERIAPPTTEVYEIYEGVTYEWDNGIVKDVHHVRAMTEQEKQSKQDAVKAAWEENGFASWTFDEETCLFQPPILYPNDGKPYRWDEETTSWIEVV